MLTGRLVTLRALEPTDLEMLYKWENNPINWTVSHTLTPFSRYTLEQYIASAHLDIYSIKQIRFMIDTLETKTPVGCIDLFDFDPLNRRAGVGILIGEEVYRRKGYAKEAIQLLADYAMSVLDLHQIFCNITVDNKSSIALFSSLGFVQCGNKKEWTRKDDQWYDELMFQKLLD